MEKITADMLKLLKIRTGIAKEIGNLKNEHGLTVTDESREDELKNCLLYTSDAADDLLCVDLGGRRIIKKKRIL